MDIIILRNDKEMVKENEIKRFNDPKIVDDILSIDNKLKNIEYKLSLYRGLKNKLSKLYSKATDEIIIAYENIEQLVENLNNDNKYAELLNKIQLKDVSIFLNPLIINMENDDKLLRVERDNLISKLGNKLYDNVPIYKNEDDNVIIFESGILTNKKYTHVEMGDKLCIIDTQLGNKVAGNRGYFLTGLGVKLNRAIISYALDFLESKEFNLMETPHLVSHDVMSKITQLSDFEESLYKLEGQDKYLIATSEQPLTGQFYNTKLRKNELPMKLGGISSCYRKEAGRHGTQMAGIFRVHQFEKIEQFIVSEPDKSWEYFDLLVNNCKDFYDSLGIAYRLINIVSGALNLAAAQKYDLEAWFPGSKFYGELVSCSNVTDYFSKKINSKILENGDYVHMLNCTLVANTRTICILMETYQTDYGMDIPLVLQKYMGCDKILFKK